MWAFVKAQAAAVAPGVAEEKQAGKAVCHTFRFVQLPVSAREPYVLLAINISIPPQTLF